MNANCGDSHCSTELDSPAYRKVLWVCLFANAIMFVVQVIASHMAHSVALLANSLDFLSDAANYGISIYVLGRALTMKAKASIFKGLSLGVVGLWTAYSTFMQAFEPVIPEPFIMTIISIIALVVNVACAFLLYRYKAEDSNAASVWLCSRNDALGNIAVMFAAGGVFAFASVWPDVLVAAVMAWLALSAAWHIIGMARKELRHGVSGH
ncbi:MAG: cation transporter [Alphaproteobacteria bacterium]|nr:cation transporter [Alphaproteobacteria bacterium]